MRAIWGFLRKLLLAILILVILIVAWEALLVAFADGAVAYAWMATAGPAFVAAGAWAAANGWLFVAISLLAIAVVDPDFAAELVRSIGKAVTVLVDAATDVLREITPSWVWWVLGGAVALAVLPRRAR